MKKDFASKKIRLLFIILSLSLLTVSALFAQMRNITGAELVKDMKAGWNLGNTLDAPGPETIWGNPVTTEAMIASVRAKGFKTIRLPITWNPHVGPAPNYIINSARLDRIEEIVNWVLDHGMYAIINIHHDDSQLIPTYAEAAKGEEFVTAIWSQVANRFKNYNDYLIFETLNEPRLKGSPQEWTGGTPEGRDVVNRYNRAALNAIRSTGGNNAVRFVTMVPYGANDGNAALGDLYIPPNDSKILVAVHNYLPWDFCGDSGGRNYWGSAQDKTQMDNNLNRVAALLNSKGVAGYMGEWGTIDKNNTAARVDHTDYYAKGMIARGIAPIWWDNGGDFSIFTRRSLGWHFEGIANTIINAAGGADPNITPVPTLTPTPSPTPYIPPADAYTLIEAEDYSTMSGIQAEDCLEGGRNIGYIDPGDWAAYNSVNFYNGTSSIEIRIASANIGGTVEVRVGNQYGQLLGSVAVPGTDGWQSWQSVTAPLSNITGTQDLYLIFTGADDGLFNINWFRITGYSGPEPTLPPVGSKGDVNGDGTITIIDALMTAQFYVELNPPGFIRANGDVNCDGQITIIDALMIAQHYVGLINTFPCSNTTPTMTPTPTIASTPTRVPTPTPNTNPGSIPANATFNNIAKMMKAGWNLGNTFDAAVKNNYESNWGAPKTTQAMIDELKRKGFNLIRLPISFHSCVDASTMTIPPAMLARYKEVVDYCRNNDMFVIINSHHDNDHNNPPAFYDMGTNYRTETRNYLTAIWTQLAAAFKDYDNHLIFESMNEPQAKDGEVVGGSTSNPYWYDANNPASINTIRNLNDANQIFVDVVRASGGNNRNRFLLIPSIAANSQYAMAQEFQVPTDNSDYPNRIIVSVHSYTPNWMSLSGTDPNFDPNAQEGTWIRSMMTNLYNRFTKNGIGVIIGEWGTTNLNNTPERIEHANFYVSEASKNGIVCVWWDNGGRNVGGENFELFRRSALSWPFPGLAEAVVSNGNIATIP